MVESPAGKQGLSCQRRNAPNFEASKASKASKFYSSVIPLLVTEIQARRVCAVSGFCVMEGFARPRTWSFLHTTPQLLILRAAHAALIL